jgi:hypothetical protein
VEEPKGPAHRFPQESIQSLKTALIKNIIGENIPE